MSQFADLPISKTEILRHMRDFGCHSDAVIRTQPLLALLYLRQLNEVWFNAQPERYSKFEHHWQQLLHGNGPPASFFDHDVHRDAAVKASRKLYAALAIDLGYRHTNWTMPPDTSKADSFIDVHSALCELDDAVNRRAGHSEDPRDPKADAAALDALAERSKHIWHATAAQLRLMQLYVANIATSIANHQGKPSAGPQGDVSDAMLQEALASSSDDQRAAIEYINRRAISATNRLDLDAAFALVDPLHRDFASSTHWRSESIGALFGTFGIVCALIAQRDHDREFVDLADKYFADARPHFTAPGDLLRQQVYALHAAVTRSRLAPDDDAARDTLLHRVLAAEMMLNDAFLDRRDYLIGAYLKGCDALGRRPESYKQCVHAVGSALRDLDAAVNDPMSHGLVCATGWLLLTKGDAAPQSAQKFLTRFAGQPGLVAFIARLFIAEHARRTGAPTDATDLLAALPDDARAAWGQFLGDAISQPEHSLITRVPFNFA